MADILITPLSGTLEYRSGSATTGSTRYAINYNEIANTLSIVSSSQNVLQVNSSGITSNTTWGHSGSLTVSGTINAAGYSIIAGTFFGFVPSASVAISASTARQSVTSSVALSSSYAVTASVLTGIAPSASVLVGGVAQYIRTHIPLAAVFGPNIYLYGIPAAPTDIIYRNRVRANLTGATSASLSAFVDTAAPSGTQLAVQYSTDNVSWFNLGGASGPFIDLSQTGSLKSVEVPIQPLAQNDVILRPVTLNGDGSGSVELGNISLELYWPVFPRQ